MSTPSESPGTPPITAEMRQAARERANGYLYVIDRGYDPDGDVPNHGIKGAFAVDHAGEIGEFHPNPDYRPSAAERGDAPASLVDLAMREAMAGRLAQEQLLTQIAGAVLPVMTAEDGDLLLPEDEHGPCLMAYSALSVVPEDVRTEWTYLPRAIRLLPTGASVVLNGSGGLQARFPVPDLLEVLRTYYLLVDRADGGFDVGPEMWLEHGSRFAELAGEQAFAAAERALARWSTLREGAYREGARTLVLGLEAAELLLNCGVDDPDVLAAAAAFPGVEPRLGGFRERVAKVPDEGLPVAMLLKAAASQQLPDDLPPDRAEVAVHDHIAHLHATPWQVRAIVLANQVASANSRFLHPQLREERVRRLNGPLLTCVQGVPDALRHQAAELVGVAPDEPGLFRPIQRPAPAITSDVQALELVRSALGPAEPLEVADIGPAYAVRSAPVPHEIHFVHKVWGSVTTATDQGGAIDEYRARCELFPVDPAVLREAPTPADRFRAAMLAGAVGDALGYPVEFSDIGTIRHEHGEQGLREMVLRDGVARFSDDTQMMLFTLEGLIRAHVARRIKPVDNDPVPEVQHAYQRWYFTQQTEPWARAGGPYAQHLPEPDGWLITNPGLFAQRAPGGTCMQAAANFARTHRHATPQTPINGSKGCGGVMRAAPVAVWSNDPAEVFWAAVGTAALTHGHPSGFLSAGVLAVIVHQLIRGVPPADAVRLARELLVRWPQHEEQLRALDAAVELAERGPVSPEELSERLGGGWVGEEALAIGLYAALATDDFREALLLSVNHSGDSDSTGIVCGNIAGALHGTRAVPPEWLQVLEMRDVIEALTADALAEFSPAPPADPSWTQRYPAW